MQFFKGDSTNDDDDDKSYSGTRSHYEFYRPVRNHQQDLNTGHPWMSPIVLRKPLVISSQIKNFIVPQRFNDLPDAVENNIVSALPSSLVCFYTKGFKVMTA